MSFAEKTLKCVNCRKTFIFTVAQQESQIARGYPNNPARCRPCNLARKNYRVPEDNGGSSPVRSANYLR
jgi:hypothetical protein